MDDVVETWSREFGMRPAVENTKYLMEVLAGTKNPHKHRHKDLVALEGSLDKVGFKNIIMLWNDPKTGKPEVIYGGGRIMAGDRKGYERLPVVWAQDFDRIKAKFLRLADNRVPQLAPAYDESMIIEDLKELQKASLDVGFLKWDKYDRFLVDDLVAAADAAAEQLLAVSSPPTVVADDGDYDATTGPAVASAPGQPPADESQPERRAVEPAPAGDVVFPSDNEWGIPTLSLKFQAVDLELPFVKWGEMATSKLRSGTWHFYIDDYKFDAIWRNPNAPLMSGATALVEPNYTLNRSTPPAIMLCHTYHKRWLARYWQSRGLRILVDMNVADAGDEINLIGVPEGWAAYCTRGYANMPETSLEEYKLACNRAGTDDIMFVVYGGGKAVEKLCADNNLRYIPDRMSAIKSSAPLDGLKPTVDAKEYESL